MVPDPAKLWVRSQCAPEDEPTRTRQFVTQVPPFIFYGSIMVCRLDESFLSKDAHGLHNFFCGRGAVARRHYFACYRMLGTPKQSFHSRPIRTVSPKGAVLRESVTHSTGYSGVSGNESQHKSVR